MEKVARIKGKRQNSGRVLVGIDPDIDKSGVAEISKEGKALYVASLTLSDLFLYVDGKKADEYLFVVEAGYLNRSFFHLLAKDPPRVAAKKGHAVGRNHQVALCIRDYIRLRGHEVIEKKPLIKCWRGRDRKISQAEIEAIIPDFPKRSNQEERDAALIAYSIF